MDFTAHEISFCNIPFYETQSITIKQRIPVACRAEHMQIFLLISLCVPVQSSREITISPTRRAGRMQLLLLISLCAPAHKKRPPTHLSASKVSYFLILKLKSEVPSHGYAGDCWLNLFYYSLLTYKDFTKYYHICQLGNKRYFYAKNQKS